MPPTPTSNSVVRQLQVVFTISTLLLLLSLAASFYSIDRLIRNSELVNHTNEVLLEAENIISLIKDAETGQRGYLVTQNPIFLEPYSGSKEKVKLSYERLRGLVADNPAQLKNLERTRELYEARFAQMEKVIGIINRTILGKYDPALQNREMIKGKLIMDELRQTISLIRRNEAGTLKKRTQQQQFYITATPYVLVLAALISMFLTTLAYLRIRKDIAERVARQQADEEKYYDTLRRITQLEAVTGAIAGGDYAARSNDIRDDDLGQVAAALNQMAASLEQTFTELKTKNWLQAGAVRIGDAIRGEKDLRQFGNRLITTLAEYVQAPLGTIYLLETDGTYGLSGTYAARDAPAKIHPGEGLVGQAITNRQTAVISNLPPDYHPISSSLGEVTPAALLICPLVLDNTCLGVIELGMFRPPDPEEITLLERNREAIAIGVNAALDFVRLQNLLEETQAQAEELQTKQEDLEQINSELEMQAQKLQASEEELRVQQEELQQTNAELEERGMLLEERNNDILKKAAELEQATRYKSEFLANMSHELRTPLNSILLLSRLLSENGEQNLSSDQVDYARVIQSAGNGLLGLIDEILDLSKIEAGQMKVAIQSVALADITDELQSLFGVLAKEKGLDFTINVSAEVPTHLETDAQRLGQILKNLIANALKFTAQGSVTLDIQLRPSSSNPYCFAVRDTGIGIAPEKQPLVFEAFQQADGSTKRHYGGTGLGLSISRELTHLLGGEITLSSEEGKGSTFTVCLPMKGSNETRPMPVSIMSSHKVKMESQMKGAVDFVDKPMAFEQMQAVFNKIEQVVNRENKKVLILEDNPKHAQALSYFLATFNINAELKNELNEGIDALRQEAIDCVILDMGIPDQKAYETLDLVRKSPGLEDLPIIIFTGKSLSLTEELRIKKYADSIIVKTAHSYQRMLDEVSLFLHLVEENRSDKGKTTLSKKLGAFSQVLNGKTVLVADDDVRNIFSLSKALEQFNMRVVAALDGREALERLAENPNIDAVLLDMMMPHLDGYETVRQIRENPQWRTLPVIAVTAKAMTGDREKCIQAGASDYITKPVDVDQLISLLRVWLYDNDSGPRN
jgi:signal transduction histidine kinase/CheY-like chemotaxis protein/CHASE3 domain sensor protein